MARSSLRRPNNAFGANNKPAGPGAFVSGRSMEIDTQVRTNLGYGDITSFTADGGNGPDAVIHEEGHLLGLGQAGPYNFSVNPATQQFNEYDTLQYSIMSYIAPDDPTAKYFGS